MIYRRNAKKGEATYSPKSHSAPHFVGHYVEGMEEWASWYCFNKKEDGTYEAELDEAWDEGSHYGGGERGMQRIACTECACVPT